MHVHRPDPLALGTRSLVNSRQPLLHLRIRQHLGNFQERPALPTSVIAEAKIPISGTSKENSGMTIGAFRHGWMGYPNVRPQP